MNRDQLDKRNTDAIHHWWVTMRDTGKVAPGLLDDLAGIADEYAADAATVDQFTERHPRAATTLRDDYGTSDTPPLAAASPDPETLLAVTGTPAEVAHSSARTRTRTRTRGNTG